MRKAIVAGLMCLTLTALGEDQNANANAQAQYAQMERAISDLVRESNYLNQNLSTMAGHFSRVTRRLQNEARNGSSPYQYFLKETVHLVQSREGFTAFAGPNELVTQARSLKESFDRSAYLSAQIAEHSLRTKFLTKVQPAYAQTLTTTYVWLEFVRNEYLYNGRYQKGSRHYNALVPYIEKVHEQAQAILGIMATLRNNQIFASDTHFEQTYASYFHAGLLLNLDSRTPQYDLTHYFAHFYAPALVPNKSDAQLIEELAAKYPELRDVQAIRTVLERIRNPRAVNASQNGQNPDNMSSSNHDDEVAPSFDPQSQGSAFLVEPPYVKNSEELTQVILALQLQRDRPNLALDEELQERLARAESILTELSVNVRSLSNTADLVRELINSQNLSKMAIQSSLDAILTGPNGIRPHYPRPMLPPPPKHEPNVQQNSNTVTEEFKLPPPVNPQSNDDDEDRWTLEVRRGTDDN